MKLLDRVSLTGADDRTCLDGLRVLGQAYPFVEWALLYAPHAEGAPRNPGRAWREAFFDAQVPGHSAVHLCGSLAFGQLLQGELPSDILKADRMQLNINVRKREFTDAQVLEVYEKALNLGPDLILQYHADSADIIGRFLFALASSDRARVHVLLDDSRGRGIAPAAWRRPQELDGVFCGYAGSLGPNNIQGVVAQLEQLGEPFWPDMESGIRTDNQFDMAKARAVLRACA